MLVLSRRVGEEIVLPNCGVTIGVVAVKGSKVRLGIAAPPETSVHRKEVWHRISKSRESGHDDDGTDWQRAVRRTIAARTHGHVQGLEVEFVDGRVIVHGRSRSYYGRQLACAVALAFMSTQDAIPIHQVELDIEVLKM